MISGTNVTHGEAVLSCLPVVGAFCALYYGLNRNDIPPIPSPKTERQRDYRRKSQDFKEKYDEYAACWSGFSIATATHGKVLKVSVAASEAASPTIAAASAALKTSRAAAAASASFASAGKATAKIAAQITASIADSQLVLASVAAAKEAAQKTDESFRESWQAASDASAAEEKATEAIASADHAVIERVGASIDNMVGYSKLIGYKEKITDLQNQPLETASQLALQELKDYSIALNDYKKKINILPPSKAFLSKCALVSNLSTFICLIIAVALNIFTILFSIPFFLVITASSVLHSVIIYKQQSLSQEDLPIEDASVEDPPLPEPA